MPYPVGITTRAVTMGGATALESAEALILQATIQSSRGLIWHATGWRFPSVAHVATSTAGAEITINLPVTDLPGWALIDSEGTILDVSVPGSYSHTYTVTLVALTSANRPVSTRTIGPFVLPTGDGSPVDLDTLLPAGTQAGGVVLVPDTWGPLVVAAEAAANAAAEDAAQVGAAMTVATTAVADAARANRRASQPGIYSLITGSDEEVTWSRIGFNPVTLDTVNTRINGRAWKLQASGATSNPYVDFTPPNSPITIPSAQALCMWVHIPDASNVTQIWVSLFQDLAGAVTISRATGSGDFSPQPLVNGWNFVRFALGPMIEPKPAWTGTQIAKIRIRLDIPSGATNEITLGHVYLECPTQARIVFVLDRGYKSFIINGGLARAREVGVPITWAVDVLKIGGDVGTGGEAVTAAELRAAWQEGDSISFHGYTANPTATMTDAQARADTMQCIKWLAANGYEGRIWRAAWVQNQGPAAAVKGLLLGQAYSNSQTLAYPTGTIVDAWPPMNMHSIYRWGVQSTGSSAAVVDAQLSILKRTRGFAVPYMHGLIGPVGSTGAAAGVPVNDTGIAEMNYFFDKVAAGMAEGWLRPSTFEELWRESGGSFSQMGGGTLATWTDPDGAPRTKMLL